METQKFIQDGVNITCEKTGEWYYVYAEKNKAFCKSFGKTERTINGRKSIIEANISLTLPEALKIVAQKFNSEGRVEK